MSEQINKVICNLPQAFTTAEQKQARDNIGAMAASASSLFFSGCSANAPITGNGTSGSPLGLSSRVTLASAGAMNDMTPFYQQFTASSNLSSLHQAGYSDYEQAHYTSWIDPKKLVFKNDSGVQEQVDYSSIQRWNSYSGGTTVSANNGITGDGSTSSPIGLSSRIEFPSANSAAAIGHRGMTVSTDSHTAWYYGAFASFEKATASANYYADRAEFINASGTSVVNKSSIDRWNSMGSETVTWFGDDYTIASANTVETGYNWVKRTVSATGLPALPLYGFGSLPANAMNVVGSGGVFHKYEPPYSAIYLSGAETTYGSSYLPAGVTWPMRVDVWNLSHQTVNLMTDTFHGTTSNLDHGSSVTVWYVPELTRWTDMANI